jgi:hypothetical protein
MRTDRLVRHTSLAEEASPPNPRPSFRIREQGGPKVRIRFPPAESRVRTRLTAHASQHQRRTPRLLVNGSQLWRLRQVEQVVEEDRVVARHDIRRPCRGCQRDRGAGHLHGSQHSANSGENRRSSQPRNRRRNHKACARPAACALVTTFYTYPEPTPT